MIQQCSTAILATRVALCNVPLCFKRRNISHDGFTILIDNDEYWEPQFSVDGGRAIVYYTIVDYKIPQTRTFNFLFYIILYTTTVLYRIVL